MTREAKIGLLMVAVLVGVFGFLVYKRVNRPTDPAAETDSQIAEVSDSDVSEPNTTSPFDDDPLPLPKQHHSKIAREIEVVAHNVEQAAQDVVEELTPELPGRDRRENAVLAAELLSDAEDEPQLPSSRNTNERTGGVRSRESIDDQTDGAPVELPRIPQTASDNNTDADPFDRVPAVSQVPSIQFEKPVNRLDQMDSDADNTDDETDIEDAKINRATRDNTDPVDEPVDTRQPTRQPEFSPRGNRRAAPMSVPDDDTSLAVDATNSSLISGESYTVQQNDNFWSISKKRYGTGRYFMALATHNQQAIPDPKRMKPGIVIATPDASVLEQLYGDSISKAADDSSDSISTTQTRSSANSGGSGFFVADDGFPMYRVGPKDTLSEIARNHLRRTSRWVQIREMNRNVLRDGNELKTGTVLRLPADARPIRVEGSMDNLR